VDVPILQTLWIRVRSENDVSAWIVRLKQQQDVVVETGRVDPRVVVCSKMPSAVWELGEEIGVGTVDATGECIMVIGARDATDRPGEIGNSGGVGNNRTEDKSAIYNEGVVCEKALLEKNNALEAGGGRVEVDDGQGHFSQSEQSNTHTRDVRNGKVEGRNARR
jgi:hypothetical protein